MYDHDYNIIRSILSNLFYLTCLAHALNLVIGQIRNNCEHVNKRVNKEAFVKESMRVKMYKKIYPKLSIPPEPLLIRWGTWIHATLINEKRNWNAIQNVV